MAQAELNGINSVGGVEGTLYQVNLHFASELLLVHTTSPSITSAGKVITSRCDAYSFSDTHRVQSRQLSNSITKGNNFSINIVGSLCRYVVK